jgi:putative hemolysin
MLTYDSISLFLTLLTFLSLVGLFVVDALRHIGNRQRKLIVDSFLAAPRPPLYWKLHRFVCGDSRPEFFFFSLLLARYILLIAYIILYCTAFLGSLSLVQYLTEYAWMNFLEVLKFFGFCFVLIATVTVFSDILPRTWAYYSPNSLFKFAAAPTSLVLLILSPITLFICRLVKLASPQATFSSLNAPQNEFADFLTEIQQEFSFSENDKRLLLSVLNFRSRIAREIMRPRVGLFCIPEDLTLSQAAEMLQREGYSRVPVYRGTIDSIVGVLFYKDVLSKYIAATEAHEQNELSVPIKTLVKKVFYCPETKKISSLLQEFRKRQTHIAIVVDEYGGTSGIVTIEDILEEIVGEISDEYDDQETLFQKAPAGGGWIVDARMNLLDVEEEIGIKIPQEEDYDTIAGYVFYRVGSIPHAGLVLHHDNFEIEVLKSNDRMVQEVRISPIPHINTP